MTKNQLSSTQCFLDPPHFGVFLDSLPLVTPDEALKILQSCPNKSSRMDYMPTSLILVCKPVFSHHICRLANLSFTQGYFTSSFKLASITPLQKKTNLYKSLPANYYPISNLNTIAKIMECFFSQGLNILFPHQPTLISFNPPIAAITLLKQEFFPPSTTLSTPLTIASLGFLFLLISAPRSNFDTTDHCILSNRLETSLGVSATVLSWLSSYLTERQESVSVGGHSSTFVVCL
jgi:hypothetical protein